MDNREIHENFYTGVLELQELCEQFIEENNLFFENCPHHNRFANKWLRGEWFKLEQSDIDYLLKRYDGSVWENPSKQLELKGLGIKNEIKK